MLLLAIPFASGCFAIADLDRFHGPPGASPSYGASGKSVVAADLVVALGERRAYDVELRVVDDAGMVVTRLVVEREAIRANEISMRDVIPTTGGYRVDLFEHRADTPVFVARVPLERATAGYRADFTHASSSPTNVASNAREVGADASIEIVGLAGHVGTSFEARVIERSPTGDDDRVVGLYRFAARDANAALVVAGCVKATSVYDVVIHVGDDSDTHDLDLDVRAAGSITGVHVTFDMKSVRRPAD